MNTKNTIYNTIQQSINKLYSIDIQNIELQITKKEFEGNYTLVIFPLIKLLKENPEIIAQKIGNYLVENYQEITAFNVVKGFLNLTVSDEVLLNDIRTNATVPLKINPVANENVMVEYASPNTNKPLHLGHIRNILLGFSVANIKEAVGNKVIKSQIINDRGIHICKSMLAYQKFSTDETPETSHIKGDKLVGNYYVKFDQEYQKQIAALIAKGIEKEQAKKQAEIIIEAQQMLQKWEENHTEVRNLWQKLNNWVYQGFNETYKKLGVDFDLIQYESNTYVLGKDLVQQGVEKGVFIKNADNSITCDLSDKGLDSKIVQRSDGTSVYITQDIGTAVERFKNYNLDELIYTVGNEQDYHFKVLFEILKKLGFSWADKLYHLSYGMVDLPSGKMKSREGTVVDADDLIDEMKQTAKEKAENLGKLENYSEQEKEELYQKIGLAALKYYILKVDAKKRILFDPNESIDFNGNTGPFLLYTYARIQSLLRNATQTDFQFSTTIKLNNQEKDLIIQLNQYQEVIEKSAQTLMPSLIANYTYDLVKMYNSFYQENTILKAENKDISQFRLALSHCVAKTIKHALQLLGIETVERM